MYNDYSLFTKWKRPYLSSIRILLLYLLILSCVSLRNHERYHRKISCSSIFHGMYPKIEYTSSRINPIQGANTRIETTCHKYDPFLFLCLCLKISTDLLYEIMYFKGTREGKSSWGFVAIKGSNISRGIRRLIMSTFESFSRIISK